MAYNRLTLPALKLTKRPTVGSKSVDVLQRSHPPPATQLLQQASPNPPSFEELLPSTSGGTGEPTEHELACRASVAGWKEVQEELRKAVTQSAAMPLGQLCIFCEEAACVRCRQCGPRGFFCSPCFTKMHSNINIFHVPETWEVRNTLCTLHDYAPP